MKTHTIDVAILGAGTAGLVARRAAKNAGKSVLVIDPGPFGTTCARVGCMPSKLLIAAAEAAHHAHGAHRFGVHPENVRIDGTQVLERVQRERDRFVGFVLKVIEEAKQAQELMIGWGKLVEPGHLVVDDHTNVHFKSLVIATGGRSFTAPPFRDLENSLLTNETIFEIKDLPKSLLVVGLGVIGLELGQAFHRLGVRTTLVGVGGALGPIRDPEILASAKKILSRELDLHPTYELEKIVQEQGGVRLDFVDSTGNQRSETYEKVLMAAGRQTNLNQLGLERIGVEPLERGRYPIDPDTLQLAGLPIFVAGDVNNLHPLLHEAADDGRIAGSNAAQYPDIRAATRRTPLAIVFSDPQIAIVGKGYGALRECEAVVGEVDYGDQGRARVHEMHAGKVRLYAEKHSGQLLGGELFGPRVEHLAHLVALAIHQGLTVDQLLEMPFYHPVIEEGLRTALRDLNANLRRGTPIKCPVSELGVGA